MKSLPDSVRASQLKKLRIKLAPIHSAFKPGSWARGPGRRERGQTFEQYLRGRPVRPIGGRKVIVIQPLGAFTPAQRKIVTLTAEFLGLYFGTPTRLQTIVPESVIPARARRTHPNWGVKQILSTWVLDHLLKPRLPADAAAYIALSATDLWPGRGWNFVFGQASLRDRVGVWSMFRNGDPTKKPALCLLRTLKTATHETGHIFSLDHCTAWQCNLNGSNDRRESDSRPIALCPQCLPKVCWATRLDPLKRFAALEQFCRRNRLAKQALFYNKSRKRAT